MNTCRLLRIGRRHLHKCRRRHRCRRGREVLDLGGDAEPRAVRVGVGEDAAVGKVNERLDDQGERAVDPANVVATIYHSLGFDLDTMLPGPNGRPFPLVDFGKDAITELF